MLIYPTCPLWLVRSCAKASKQMSFESHVPLFKADHVHLYAVSKYKEYFICLLQSLGKEKEP